MSDFNVETGVRRLIDEADISRLVLRYASGLDSRRFEEVVECFDPDGHMVGVAGSAVVRDYLPGLFERVRAFGATMHFMGNQLITIDGDTATTETYALAHHFADVEGTREALVVGVRYDDKIARQADGRWLITDRVVHTMWERSTPQEVSQ